MLLSADLVLDDCLRDLGGPPPSERKTSSAAPLLQLSEEEQVEVIKMCLQRVLDIKSELQCWGESEHVGQADRIIALLERMARRPSGIRQFLGDALQQLGEFDRALGELCPLRQHPTDWDGSRVADRDPDGFITQPGWAVALLTHRSKEFPFERVFWRAVRQTFHNVKATRVRPFDPREPGRERGKRRTMYRFRYEDKRTPRSVVRVDHDAYERARRRRLINELDRELTPYGLEGDYTAAYFFVPKSDSMDTDAMLRCLLGLGWQLASLSPTPEGNSQLEFLLCAGPGHVEWGGPAQAVASSHRGELPESEDGTRDPHSSPSILEDDAIFDQLSLLFADRKLLNTAVVHSSMVFNQSSVMARWFRPVWRMPHPFRPSSPEKSREWLWATRFMSGQPGDGCAVDIGSGAIESNVELYDCAGGKPKHQAKSQATRKKGRAPTRVLLRRPVLCRLKQSNGAVRPDADPVAAYLLDYSPLSVALNVPSASNWGKLDTDAKFVLELPDGLPWPWVGPPDRRLDRTTLKCSYLPVESKEPTRVTLRIESEAMAGQGTASAGGL
jgi:hypothetical protein